MELQDPVVIRVQLDLLEIPDTREPLVLLDFRVLMVLKELSVLLEPLVFRE